MKSLRVLFLALALSLSSTVMADNEGGRVGNVMGNPKPPTNNSADAGEGGRVGNGGGYAIEYHVTLIELLSSMTSKTLPRAVKFAEATRSKIDRIEVYAEGDRTTKCIESYRSPRGGLRACRYVVSPRPLVIINAKQWMNYSTYERTIQIIASFLTIFERERRLAYDNIPVHQLSRQLVGQFLPEAVVNQNMFPASSGRCQALDNHVFYANLLEDRIRKLVKEWGPRLRREIPASIRERYFGPRFPFDALAEVSAEVKVEAVVRDLYLGTSPKLLFAWNNGSALGPWDSDRFEKEGPLPVLRSNPKIVFNLCAVYPLSDTVIRALVLHELLPFLGIPDEGYRRSLPFLREAAPYWVR